MKEFRQDNKLPSMISMGVSIAAKREASPPKLAAAGQKPPPTINNQPSNFKTQSQTPMPLKHHSRTKKMWCCHYSSIYLDFLCSQYSVFHRFLLRQTSTKSFPTSRGIYLQCEIAIIRKPEMLQPMRLCPILPVSVSYVVI